MKNNNIESKLSKIPRYFISHYVSHKFSSSEFNKIIKGYHAGSMDEKWNINYENDKLYFHRSWTGILFYIAKFRKKRNYYILHEIVSYSDNERNIQDMNFNFDKVFIFRFIYGRILGKNIPIKLKIIEHYNNFPANLKNNCRVYFSLIKEDFKFIKNFRKSTQEYNKISKYINKKPLSMCMNIKVFLLAIVKTIYHLLPLVLLIISLIIFFEVLI